MVALCRQIPGRFVCVLGARACTVAAMRAAFAKAVGGDEPLSNLEIGDQPRPRADAGHVLIKVAAASLNHHDLWTLRGVTSRPVTPPQILGCDAAGIIQEIGDGVPGESLKTGQRVVVHAVIKCNRCESCVRGEGELHCQSIGILSDPPYPGTLAEYVAVPARNIVALPENVDFETAACLPTAYLTAYRMLFVRANLKPGMKVLVHGATGGVATAAILLAKSAGVEVLATARDAEKQHFAQEIGAAAAFATDRDSLKQLLRETGGVDAVMETVGEPTWDFSLRAVRPGGTVVVAGATGGPNPPAQLNRIFWRHITIAGTSMGTRDELEQLVRMCVESNLKPLIGAVHEWNELADAFAEFDRGEQRGKTVIRV